MATSADVARKLLRISERIARKVAYEPTGVVPGYHFGPGLTITEDGRIRYVKPTVPLVTLRYAIFSNEADTPSPDSWALVEDTLSIASAVDDHYELTIPSDGSYRMTMSKKVIGGTIDPPSGGWRDGDHWTVYAYVNGSSAGTIAELVVTADSDPETLLTISGSLTLSLITGDIVYPVVEWTNTLDEPDGARGTTEEMDLADYALFSLYQG